jgi:mRNA interferase RelE/StbE
MASPPRTYSIIVLRPAARAIARLRPDVRTRVRQAIRTLAAEPRPVGCRRLVATDELYRVRVVDYRIVYEVRDGQLVVAVVKVGHRRDVYR